CAVPAGRPQLGGTRAAVLVAADRHRVGRVDVLARADAVDVETPARRRHEVHRRAPAGRPPERSLDELRLGHCHCLRSCTTVCNSVAECSRGLLQWATHGNCPWYPRRVEEERMLTVRQVAERLQLNRETVRRWIRAGKLRA